MNNSIFSGNSAGGSGGGMWNYTYSSPTLTNSTFSGNSAINSGGGMYNYNYSSPTLTNCTFNTNSASGVNANGGGMYNRYFSDPTVTNSIFSGNSANGAGGAMYVWDSCILTLSNSTFSQNSAVNGKALAFDDPQGWHPPSTLEVTNCILWDGGGEIWNNDGSTITIDYSDVEGGWSGTGGNNISADPLFADADLRLSAGSPCIDAGDNTAVPGSVTTDLDGNARFIDHPGTADTGNGTAPIADMGAYEYSNTPTGSNVIVNLGPGIVAFAEVTAPGVTSLITSSSGPEPPAGFMPGDPETYYDLSTTATYNGDIEVSIDYSGISYTNESSLRLMHYVDTDSDGTADAWVDATTSLDTGANIICGTVTSLSFFGVFEEFENQPPTADAGGPYTVDEGSSVVLDGSGSADPDQTTASLIYEWDLDNDGDYDDATGINPTFSAIALDGPTSVTVGLRVTDSYGESDTDTATIDVNNVAPAVGAGDDVTIDEGETVFFSGTASDVGDDTITYLWDFGDGTEESGTLAPSHAYGDNGEYTVTLYVTDDDGATTSDTLTVTVNNVDPNVETIFLDVEITLRISGEKGNSVELMIEQEGDELRRLKLVRTTGAPNEGSVSVSIDLSKDYTATLYFESENKKGATPVWLGVDDHIVKITTFNAQKKKTSLRTAVVILVSKCPLQASH